MFFGTIFLHFKGKIMQFFLKYPDGTDCLAGLQCFKCKTLKLKHVQDMHRHLFCEQNTPEKKITLVSRFEFFIRK
jgi:hypothetical protein